MSPQDMREAKGSYRLLLSPPLDFRLSGVYNVIKVTEEVVTVYHNCLLPFPLHMELIAPWLKVEEGYWSRT